MKKVEWSPQALRQWEITARYIFQKFGRKTAEKFAKETAKCEAYLAANPQSGHLEPLLQAKSKTYHSLTFQKYNKLIYYIEKDTIHIADLWDTRRDPGHLAQSIENP